MNHLRSAQLTIRLTRHERRRIDETALRGGMTVGGWARRVLLDAALAIPPQPTVHTHRRHDRLRSHKHLAGHISHGHYPDEQDLLAISAWWHDQTLQLGIDKATQRLRAVYGKRITREVTR